MRPSRTIARLGALAGLMATASLWTRMAMDSRAAPADFLDVPGSLAANADGDVYVSFATDHGAAVVRRFSADGVVLGRWSVSGGSDIHPYQIAEAHDGGVYVALDDLDVVRHYSKDGQQTEEWPIAGLENAIATTPGGDAANTDVYVVTSLLGGERAVLQYDPAGSLRASFPVERSTYDLAVWPKGGADEASVAVAEAARNPYPHAFVSRYSEAGTWLDGWGADGAIAGMDVDGAANALWYGVSEAEYTRRIDAVNRDRTRGPRCRLRWYPIDLTVGQGGDLYVLTDKDPSRPIDRELQRYSQDCALLDTWDLEQLNGLEQPTPTGPTGAPSDTPTATPSGSETPTATLVTATATPQEGYPTSATPTNTAIDMITPTPVLYPQRGWLPIAWRSGG